MTEHTDIQSMKNALATYREAAAQLRQSISQMARARAELDRAQDTLHDARAASEVAHSDKPKGRAAQFVAAEVYDQEARARGARDVLRLAERDLEQAKAAERADREELVSFRALVLLLAPLGSATL